MSEIRTKKTSRGAALMELVKHCPLPVEQSSMTGGGDPFLKDAEKRWRWAEALLSKAPDCVQAEITPAPRIATAPRAARR